MSITLSTASPGQTKKAGKVLAKQILKLNLGKKAKILGLVGDLGGGKTTFVQGLAGGLGIREKILSPTFVIMRKFKLAKSKTNSKLKIQKFKTFFHIDCYRIKESKELLGLGFKEIVSNPQNIVAIEWADRVKKILPKQTVWLRFKFINNKTRQIKTMEP